LQDDFEIDDSFVENEVQLQTVLSL
jgi:hypothetical protein